jgi:hypothetical protein
MSERNSFGSVDWPPIGSSLLPAGVNVRQEDEIGVEVGVRVSDSLSVDRSDYLLTYEDRGERGSSLCSSC